MIGIVTDNQDPKGWGRVKVNTPWLSADHASDWARVVRPAAGAERGLEFLPEIDDEVLVGFEMGDMHHPYVLGGLWNGKDRAAEEESGDGQRRQGADSGSSARAAGHQIVFDDSDGGSGITIADKNGNTIDARHRIERDDHRRERQPTIKAGCATGRRSRALIDRLTVKGASSI